MSIPERDLKILWGKAAARCSMPECRQKLVAEASNSVPSKNILVGENCHIVAEKEDGPRGKSLLTLEERNRYPNLILLCAKHHTIIDQDPTAWPIEKLHQIKSDHEIWVETQLTNISGDLASELYSDLVNTASEALMLSHWDWISDNAVRLLLSEQFVHGVDFFTTQVQRTIWPKKLPELESAILNLCERLGAYVAHFMQCAKLRYNTKRPSEGFFVEDQWWKRGWRDDYHDYVDKSKKWERKSTSLLFNVVVALNEFADAVSTHLNPKYFIFEGKFIIDDTMGVLSDLQPAIYIPDTYISIDEME